MGREEVMARCTIRKIESCNITHGYTKQRDKVSLSKVKGLKRLFGNYILCHIILDVPQLHLRPNVQRCDAKQGNNY